MKISVIIPNRNGGAAIGECLRAALSSGDEDFEVIVVDDHSEDNSPEIISGFPCRLVRLVRHSGASAARNAGAAEGTGDILFFTDSDCVLEGDTLGAVRRAVGEKGRGFVIGGTYTPEPYDRGFFGRFQSVFINYSELKKKDDPDYIATHALAIDAGVFRESGGFPESFLPILEDVEFSHRMRRMGYKLFMSPGIRVRHIFNYSLWGSLKNAFRKSKYWVMYSYRNKDLFADSGTASYELKANVVSFFLGIFALAGFFWFSAPLFLWAFLLIFVFNVAANRRLFAAFYKTGGAGFALPAVFYYLFVYPLAVGAGTAAGLWGALKGRV